VIDPSDRARTRARRCTTASCRWPKACRAFARLWISSGSNAVGE